MKKLFTLALICLMSTIVFAQTDSTKSKPKATPYVSIGVSVTNSNNFSMTSYPSFEAGICAKNLGLALVVGRGNFYQLGSPSDKIENYYYEAKATASCPIGILTGTVLLGYGQYFNVKHNFIEYGGGFSYTEGRMGYGVIYSNWDGVNYVTPCITLNF